jgi:hypothetical protein
MDTPATLRQHFKSSSSAKEDDPVFQRQMESNREAAAYFVGMMVIGWIRRELAMTTLIVSAV